MILNTGSRTDIPAYYSSWFMNRIREGCVMARNPYVPDTVHKYVLSPEIVDCIVFCTKNPKPMLEYLEELKQYRMFWFVTITPYGKAIEPNVPDKHEVLESFRRLSSAVGKKKTVWRYDPVFLLGHYDMDYHKRAFEAIASELEGYTEQCVLSFIDLYEKTKKNFPEVRSVTQEEMEELAQSFQASAVRHGIKLRTCLEDHGLGRYGLDVSGCMTQQVLEEAEDFRLHVPSRSMTREGCSCLLGNDIGAYNTCMHGCRYCYANYDMRLVRENWRRHDPDSPVLIGRLNEKDRVIDAVQKSWLDRTITLDL